MSPGGGSGGTNPFSTSLSSSFLNVSLFSYPQPRASMMVLMTLSTAFSPRDCVLPGVGVLSHSAVVLVRLLELLLGALSLPHHSLP